MRIVLIALALAGLTAAVEADPSVPEIEKLSEHIYEFQYAESVVVATYPKHFSASRDRVIFTALSNVTNKAAPVRIMLTRHGSKSESASDTSRTLRFIANGTVVEIPPSGPVDRSDPDRETVNFALSFEQAMALLRRPRPVSFGAIDLEWGDAAPYAREFAAFILLLRND